MVLPGTGVQQCLSTAQLPAVLPETSAYAIHLISLGFSLPSWSGTQMDEEKQSLSAGSAVSGQSPISEKV